MLNGVELLNKHAVFLEGRDTMMKGGAFYEIEFTGNVVAVDRSLWSSWTGIRYLNGEEYHGDVYVMGTKTPYEGPRLCTCDTCQSSTKLPTVVPVN